jgi:hypothetical protein
LVCCSGGISSTTFLDCTRGYTFDSTSTASANVKSHSPGETVIISNDDVYLTTQYVANDDDETIYGLYTYASSTLTRPYLRLGNTEYGDIGYNEGGFDLSSGSLIVKASSTAGIAVDSEGLYVDGSDDYIFSGAFSLNGSELGSISSNVTDANLNKLTAGTTSGASGLHTHGSSTAYFNKWALLDMMQDNTVMIGGYMVDSSNSGTLTQVSSNMKCATGATSGQTCEASTGDVGINFATSSVLYFRTKLLAKGASSAQVVNLGLKDGGTDPGAEGTLTSDHCSFMYASSADVGGHTGLYSSVADGTTQATTSIDLTGIDLKEYNNYRLEWDAGTDCKLYINDALKATETSNLPNTNSEVNQVKFYIRTTENADKQFQMEGNWIVITDN